MTQGNVDLGEHEHSHDHHGPGHRSGLWDDEMAAWYAENHGSHATNCMTVELARLEPNDVVVDIGCGSGEAVREAALRVTCGKAKGVDPSPAMIRIANELSASHAGLSRIEFLEGPAENVPISDGTASVVMAINSLHHWDDVQAGLAEVLRILRPGGRLFVSEEELEDGQFGHGDGQLSNSTFVMRTIKGAGFAGVSLNQHSGDEASMLTVAACKEP